MQEKVLSPELQADASGRLFDPEARQRLGDLAGPVDIAPLETLSALRLAAKHAGGGFERWLEARGLSESRFRLLLALYLSPGRHRPLHEVAAELQVVPRTITDVVNVLERDGLVRREPDPSDRRSVHAALTPAGVDLIESLKRDALARQSAALPGLSTEQLAELRHLCLLLVDRLRRAGL